MSTARGRIIVEQFEMSQMAKRGISNYRKIELPKRVIVRTENVRGKVESTKQSKIREEVMVLPEPGEGIGKNGGMIVKPVEEAKNVELKRILYREIANHVADRVKVPVIYYIVMIFGLASAIFGAVKAISPTIDITIMLGGLGIFLAAFIGFLEIKLSKDEFR
jgi:hypothetical protein